MKKKFVCRLLTVALCASLLVQCFTGCNLFTKPDPQETLTKILEEEINLTSRHHNNSLNSKEETVYVFTDATGKQTKLTINEKLNVALDCDTIEDITCLNDIKNLTGDETFTKEEDGEISWNYSGENITYQGTCDKEVPIETKITYFLDGNEIQPDELAGKSGHVTIRFDYVNHEKKKVMVGNKEKEVTVPFTMITGIMLPSDKFWNIEVTNGKVSQVREDALVLGITMPGLQNSLDIKSGDEEWDLKLPDYFEISADTENFSLETMMSIATSALLSDLDVSNLSMDKLTEQVEDLQAAADQITDGTKDLQDGTGSLSEGADRLKDGIATLTGKVPELTDGVKKLDSGAGELINGSEKLSAGTGELSQGAGKASKGAKELSEGAVSLSDGATQAAEGAATLSEGVTGYTEGVDQIAEGAKSLDDNMGAFAEGMQQFYDALANSDTPLDHGIAALLSGADQLNGGSQTLKEQLEGGMAQASESYNQSYQGFYQIAVGFVATANQVDPETAAQVLAANGIGPDANVGDANQMAVATGFLMENYSNITAMQIADQTTLVTIVSGLSQSYQAYQLTAGTLTQLNESGYFDGIAALENGILSLSQKVGTFADPKEGTLCGTLAALNTSASQLKKQGSTPLLQGLQKVSENSATLREGAAQVAEGNAALAEGAGTLSKGAAELKDGVGALAEGASALNSGADQLKNGLHTLKDGTSKLNSGANSLVQGTNELMNGAGTLSDGAQALNSGAITLKDGMIKFNNEGIQKLSNLAENDATQVIDTFKVLVDLGKDYTSFAGKKENMEGNVIFIYKIQGITTKDA